MEDLNARGVMANRRLAKTIGDVEMHEFKRQLEHKTKTPPSVAIKEKPQGRLAI